MEISQVYKEHTITVSTDNRMRFAVKGSLINTHFDSYLQATNAIDEASKKHESQTRKRISLRVFDWKGEPATITGVHAGNGKILGIEETAYSYAGFYPAVSWIGEALKKIGSLRAEMGVIDNNLKPYRMSRHSLTRRGDHSDQVDELVRLVETTAAKAQQDAPKE